MVGDGEGERHLAVHGGGGGEALAGGEERARGHAGAQDHEVDAAHGGVGDVVLAEEGDDAGRELDLGAAVVEAELGGERAQQGGRSEAARAGADDEHGALPGM